MTSLSSPPPRRVLYVLDDLPLPSQTFVVDEMRERESQGDDVRVLTLRVHGGHDGWSTVPSVWDGSRRSLVRAAAPLLLRRPAAARRARALARGATPDERPLVPWRSLVARAAALHVDVVHAHFGWSAAVRAEAVAGLVGVPWAVTFHGHDVYGQDRDLARKVAAADLPVTVCESFADHLAAVAGVRPAVVPCGVRLPPADRAAPPAEADVIAVGRLVDKKGFDVLLRAVHALPGVTLRVVGDGPMRSRLADLVDELGLASRVTMLGELPHHAVLDLIARARVCAVPSRIGADGDRDSMPLVAKEAMARVVPVVVTDIGGLPELVNDETGWRVRPDDPDALAGALSTALGDAALARRRAVAGRRAVEAHALPRSVGELRKITEEVLSVRKTDRGRTADRPPRLP